MTTGRPMLLRRPSRPPRAGGDVAAGHLDPEPLHGVLEVLAVLAPLDRVDVDADDLDPVLLEDPLAGQRRGEVQAGLPAQVRQQGVGPLLRDDLREGVHVQRLDVGHVRHAGVGHDRRGVRVDQDDLVPQFPQGLARLRPRVVELACLPDDDRAGPDDQDFADVVASRHGFSLGPGDVSTGYREDIPPVVKRMPGILPSVETDPRENSSRQADPRNKNYNIRRQQEPIDVIQRFQSDRRSLQ